MAFVPQYILILFALIGIDYTMARLIEQAHGHTRRTYLIISICATVGILFIFKYFNFFNANIAALAQALHWQYSISALQLILPLGLSFHTFQSLSYVIEVYRGKFAAERNIGVYALYVLFFPQLIAGPIERPQHLLTQLQRLEDVVFSSSAVASGIRLMAWGFFKKLVIADRLAIAVDYVYAHSEVATGLSVVVAVVFFAFQLYADFSGYSDIARGTARVFGIELVRNFERPYFSASIAEFWRRWHISLSAWFRDYFYFPLVYAKQRATRPWLYVCVVTTFTVTGMWHGAGWTYIMMGWLFGTYIVLGMITKQWRDRFVHLVGLDRIPRVHRVVQVMQTFVLVSVTWIFFRAPDMHVASNLLTNLFTNWHLTFAQVLQNYFLTPYATLGFGRGELLLSLMGIGALVGTEYLQDTRPFLKNLDSSSWGTRSFAYSGLALAIVVFGVFTTKQFIYFQF